MIIPRIFGWILSYIPMRTICLPSKELNDDVKFILNKLKERDYVDVVDYGSDIDASIWRYRYIVFKEGIDSERTIRISFSVCKMNIYTDSNEDGQYSCLSYDIMTSLSTNLTLFKVSDKLRKMKKRREKIGNFELQEGFFTKTERGIRESREAYSKGTNHK